MFPGRLFATFFLVSIILSSHICVFIWWNRSKYVTTNGVARESAKTRVESVGIRTIFSNGQRHWARAWERGREKESESELENQYRILFVKFFLICDMRTVLTVARWARLWNQWNCARLRLKHIFFSALVLCQLIIFYANAMTNDEGKKLQP